MVKVEKVTDYEKGTVEFKVSVHENGQIKEIGNIVIDVSDFPTEVVSKLAIRGISDRFGDSYASMNTKDAEWSGQDVLDTLQALQSAMKNGEYTVRAQGKGNKSLATKAEKALESGVISVEEMADLEAKLAKIGVKLPSVKKESEVK